MPRLIACEPDTEVWAAERNKLDLNGSDVPSVCGRGYDSMRMVYKLKKGIAKKEISPVLRELFDRGHALEDEALDTMCEWLHDGSYVMPSMGIWTLEEFAHRVGTTPDGLLMNPLRKAVEPVEVKCPLDVEAVEFGSKRWITYRIQLEVHMRALDATYGHLMVYHPSTQCRYWFCCRDDQLWMLVVPYITAYLEYFERTEEPPKQDLQHYKWDFWLKHMAQHRA